ncbi:MAG: alpha-E domain-containing protein [Peptococcaceae bacterium]|nr:alpha-E domain-containing protein [Peptococcaceae bacterium]
MGAISLEKSSQMYWLGRYTERVFTTLQAYLILFDETVDERQVLYDKFCYAMGIPDVYGSQAAFFENFLFDANDGASVMSSLDRVFDNAVVLRDEISSESLSYIHMAMEQLQLARVSKERLLVLQTILDYLYAFWGSVDDRVNSEVCRNLMKCGRYVERMDLYVRLHFSYEEVERSYYKLRGRISKAGLPYQEEKLECIGECIVSEEVLDANRQKALRCLAQLFI